MDFKTEFDGLKSGQLLLAAAKAAYGDLWRRRLPGRLGVSASYIQHVIDGSRPMSAKLHAAFLEFLDNEGDTLLVEANKAAKTLNVIRYVIMMDR